MKHVRIALGVCFTCVPLLLAQAQVVGYVNSTFYAGDNLFGNPLLHAPDDLNSLFGPSTPIGTTVSLWDATLGRFGTSSMWNGSSWSLDLTLAPGTGVLLHTPAPFTNTFTGVVLNFDGTAYHGTLSQPPPFTGANGTYLFSSRAPVALSGNVFDPNLNEFSVFEAILGRAPYDGEQVTTLNPVTQTYLTTTFSGGVWNNGAPTLQVGEAAFFNIGAVPEPTGLSLLGLGLGVLAVVRRRKAGV